jgi:hypothetical protein
VTPPLFLRDFFTEMSLPKDKIVPRADGRVPSRDWHRAFQQKETTMKKAPAFVLTMIGLALAGPVLGETIKLQIKGAY